MARGEYFKKGNAKSKEGDDYPIRLYVLFEYDEERSSWWEQLQYNFIRSLYGEKVPYSSLNYIWANQEHPESILPNPYSDKVQMILLQKGAEYQGQWMEQQVNIVEDYRRAFGESPPPFATIAIMSDSDNTKEHGIACVDDLEILSDVMPLTQNIKHF